jgi:hypothetical protein
MQPSIQLTVPSNGDGIDSNNQQWYYDVSTQSLRYKNQNTKCIDLPGGDQTNGNTLQIW